MNIIKPNLQIVHVYDESKFFYPRVMLVKCIAKFFVCKFCAKYFWFNSCSECVCILLSQHTDINFTATTEKQQSYRDSYHNAGFGADA